MKGKILHISKYYPPDTGGIEYICHQTVASQPGYEHRVICFSKGKKNVSDTYEGVEVSRCGVFAKIMGVVLPHSMYSTIRKHLREYAPDIVHFHAANPVAGLFLLPLLPKQTKLVVHFHALIKSSRLVYSLYRPLETRLLKRADRIIMTNPKMLGELERIAPFRHKAVAVDNFICTSELDITEADNDAIQKIKERYGNRKIILTFGRHVPYKGLKHLIEAEKLLKSDCEILIGGSGPITAELKAMSSSPRIHFIGHIPAEELKHYLHAADVFAFPSINYAEAFGLTLAQSMYCQTPPVTFTIPNSGVNYVCLDGVTGIEVENGNSEKFAGALDRLLSDDELRAVYARNGRQRVLERFTIKQAAGNIARIYAELTSIR